jgi:hypothetical protein
MRAVKTLASQESTRLVWVVGRGEPSTAKANAIRGETLLKAKERIGYTALILTRERCYGTWAI